MCSTSGRGRGIAGRAGGTDRSALQAVFDTASVYLLFGEEGSTVPSDSTGSGDERIAAVGCRVRILAVKAFRPCSKTLNRVVQRLRVELPVDKGLGSSELCNRKKREVAFYTRSIGVLDKRAAAIIHSLVGRRNC